MPEEKKKNRDLKPYLYLPEVKDGSWENQDSSGDSTAAAANPRASATTGMGRPWAAFTSILQPGAQHQLTNPAKEETIRLRYLPNNSHDAILGALSGKTAVKVNC